MATHWQQAVNHFAPIAKKPIKIIFEKFLDESWDDFSKASEFFFKYPVSKDYEYEFSNPRSEVFFDMLKQEMNIQFLSFFAVVKKNSKEDLNEK